jgi:D-3-phosphoglycerate dehydrogenase / 2-oxoglutarate reductase
MRPKVLIAYAGATDTSIEQSILQGIDADVVLTADLESPAARAAAREADGIMVTVQTVPADLISTMENCKIICRVGTGIDAIDIPAASARGIWVTNVPDYSIDEVSAHAIALALAQLRNLFRHRDAVLTGEWRYQAEYPIQRLSNLTLGILGLGRIGKASAKKGRGLGMRVIAHDPYIDEDEFVVAGVERVDWQELLAESDVLTLHVPLTAETRKIVNAEALALMKPTAYLVNTARGDVIDIDAMVAAVKAGTIAGAGLDVLPTEPPPPGHQILHDDRIIITPHIGWASMEAGHDVKIRGAEDVVRAILGKAPKYPCNEPTGAPVEVAAT